MKYVISVKTIWECGQRFDDEGNPHQEDSLFPAHNEQKDTDRLFILCDGMGGHAAGEVASATVCEAMSESVFRNAPDPEGFFSDDILLTAISDAYDALDALPSNNVSEGKKMGTTMTFLKLHDKGCTIAHMGDSRVYHIRPGKGRDDTKILFETKDHSLVNDLIKVGELTPEEAKHSKQKNIITRAMQPQMERRQKADIYHTADIQKGDYFYMCSDGMLEEMEDENIRFNFSGATGDDDNKVMILTQATSQNLDNHTAIIIHILDVIDPLPIPQKPVAFRKPAPIMAEVDDDDDEQVSDEHTHIGEEQSTKGEVAMSEMPCDENQIKQENEVTEQKFDGESDREDGFSLDNEKTDMSCTISRERYSNAIEKRAKFSMVKLIILAIIVVFLASGLYSFCSKDSKSEQTKSEQTKSEQKKSEQKKSEQKKSEQKKSEQKKSEQKKSEQKKSEQKKSEQKKSEQERSEQRKSEQKQSEQKQSEQKQSEQKQSEQRKTEQKQSEQTVNGPNPQKHLDPSEPMNVE